MPQDPSQTPLGRLIRVHKIICKTFFFSVGDPQFHIGFNANPDPAFYLNADTDTDPDPGRKPNPMWIQADPDPDLDPDQTFESEKVEFLHEEYTLST